jgi:hypothetical protein
MSQLGKQIERLMERAPQLPGSRQLGTAAKMIRKAVRAMDPDLSDKDVAEITSKVVTTITHETSARGKR